MSERLDPTPKSQPSIEDLVKGVLSRSGIGDTKNNFQRIAARLEVPELWPKVRLAQTYEAYIREKYQAYPGLPEAVIAASDKSFVETYDALAQKINNAIGQGVTSEQQVAAIESILREVDTFIYNYCSNLSN